MFLSFVSLNKPVSKLCYLARLKKIYSQNLIKLGIKKLCQHENQIFSLSINIVPLKRKVIKNKYAGQNFYLKNLLVIIP